MPNLVEITIKANDDTASGFASVLTRYFALKNAMRDIVIDVGDSGNVTASLIGLKQKVQSVGLADIADVNVQPGVLFQRLYYIKRAMQQVGLGDIFGFGGAGGIGRAFPVMGPTVPVGGGGTTIINNTTNETGGAGIGAAVGATAGGGGGWGGNLFGPGILGWAAAAKGVDLFAGALTSIGIPAFIASANGIHLLVQSLIETAAVVVPATLAFAAFGAAAIPTIQEIVKQEQAMYTVSQAFGLQMPGLSNGFSKIADAVQPNVYVLFGEALNTINNHTGIFMSLAKGAGQVLDNLGARAELALGGKGLNGLISTGVGDLQLLGNIAGNVFGIFGNVLKVLPGYAKLLFEGLQGITGAIERITASGFGQFLLGAGLAMHGFIVWAGLGATAAVDLGNGLLSLAAKFGLVAAGSTVFDAAAFGTAVKEAAAGVGLLGGELIGLGAAEDIAAAGSLTLGAVWAALGAVNPIVWIGAAIGGLIALVAWMASSNSAAQALTSSMQKQAQQATSFTSALGAYTSGLKQANQSISQMPKTIETAGSELGRFGGTITTQVNPAFAQMKSAAEGASSAIDLQNKRLATLNAITGSTANTTAAFNAIGLQNFNLAGMTGQAYANLVTQVKAYYAAQVQLAGFTQGQAAAAQNALTNAFMNSVLPAIQKVTNAEDALMGVLTGGEGAFTTWMQNLNQISTDAQASGASIGGLNSQSLTLANDYYNTLIPSTQQMIDKLVQQGASGKTLTSIVATSASQLMQYAGSNVAAENAIVGLINNALGPGTVSLKTLSGWIASNSGSLAGMQGKVGSLTGGVLGLSGALNALNGKTVNSYVNTYYSSYYATHGLPPGSSAGTGGTHHAYGGITAAAFGGAKGGLVTVGEHGTELIQLPGGSHVLPHGNQAAQVAAGMGGQVVVHVTADTSKLMAIGLTQAQIDAIRYEVRTKGGGSVQRTFGGTGSS